jgi:hypothetical protein
VLRRRFALSCQRPSVSPQVRPSALPTGGHVFSPLVAMSSPHGVGFRDLVYGLIAAMPSQIRAPSGRGGTAAKRSVPTLRPKELAVMEGSLSRRRGMESPVIHACALGSSRWCLARDGTSLAARRSALSHAVAPQLGDLRVDSPGEVGVSVAGLGHHDAGVLPGLEQERDVGAPQGVCRKSVRQRTV